MLAHLVYFIPQGHEVAESLRLVLGLTEQGGGVKCPHEEDAVLLNKGAVLLRHRKVGAYHPLGGDAAQADDDFRPQQTELLPQQGIPASLSAGRGSRFWGGRHLTLLAI